MFLFLWWYGVVPHQWLTWADNELSWRTDELLLEAHGQPAAHDQLPDTCATSSPWSSTAWASALHIGVWAVWQDRGKKKPAEIPTSRYGRPLVRKG